MIDEQFQQLLDAINDISGGMPTWLSLLIGSLLTIVTSIVFSIYENYQNKKYKKTQVNSLKLRLDTYLKYLIKVDNNALLKRELVLEVASKIERDLEQLLNLQYELKLDTNNLSEVMIYPILIKQYVLIDHNPYFDGLSPNMVKKTSDNAKKIQNAILEE